MAENTQLIPQEGKLVPADARVDTGLDEVFTKLSQLLQIAAAGLLLQNVQEVDEAARVAEALYDASKRDASPDQLLLMEILKNMVSLYAPLTRTLVFSAEGRFPRAREEIAKGLATSDDSIVAIEKYAQLPSAEKEALDNIRPVLTIFPVLFRGFDAYMRAEMVGYQGDIPKYRKLLHGAVTAFREAAQLPRSLNQTFLALVGMCANLAERLVTRIEVFSAEQGQRYLSPNGEKIFIIHGHDEAKWRELRELLEDRLGLKTIVLKEEPGAGETLIRKFEEFADDSCYAFALLTPDDFIEKEGKSYFQARPNVLFELGWFYGRFGRDRVCIVKKAKTEMPSDLAGIVSVDFHNDISEGLVKIEAELKRIGIVAGGTRKQARRPGKRGKK